MDDLEDNTNIIDMKKNFRKFLANSEKKKRKHGDLSESSLFDTRDFSASQAACNVSQASSVASENLKVKSDLIFCKSRNAMLETQLSNKEKELQEQNVMHDMELSTLRQKHEREMRAYEMMKTSHERVLNRQELCETELNEQQALLKHTKDVYEEKMRIYQKKIADLDMNHTKAIEEQLTKYKELKNQMAKQQTELSIAKSEISQLKDQLAEKSRKLNDSLSNSMELDDLNSRAKSAEARVSELENELQKFKDDQLIMAMRKQELAQLQSVLQENKTLKRENSYHRQMIENVEVLKEKLASAERNLRLKDDQARQLAMLSVQNEALQAKLQEMQEKTIPADTVTRLKELQERELVLSENIGQLKSRNRELENEINSVQGTCANLQGKVTGQTVNDEKNIKMIERLQKKLLLVSKERDGHKRFIESYNSEVTREVVSHANDRLQIVQQSLNSYIKVNEDLEKELAERNAHIVSLSAKVAELEQTLRNKQQSCAPAIADQFNQQTIIDLRRKIEELERQNETLTGEKDILEARIEQRNLQGDYDPTKTKVLHFSRNPASLALQARSEDLARLRQENKQLKERIKVLESNSNAHDVTSQVEANLQNPSTEETQRLKAVQSKLAVAEQRGERMVEMFKKTSLEFRQVVYQLTGYRVDIPKSNQYKLMSMYSSSPDDYLLFQQTPEGELQLLENDFASTLTDLAEQHLQRQNSIPIFLSHLTLDLYKQQTMSSMSTSSMMMPP